MRTPLLFAAAAFTLSALAQVPGNVPTSGLVAWYPLNFSMADAGPNALNGSLTGGYPAPDRYGTAGAATAFGSSSYGLVPSNALFNTGVGMTVTTWVQLSNPNTNQKILGRTNPNFNSGFILGVENGQVHPEVWNASGTAHSFMAGFIPASQYTHLAITWASSGYLVVYVNGMAADSIPAGAQGIGSNTEPLIVGGSPWSQSPLYFQVGGSVDDIGIWNRALSAAEVMAVFEAGTTGIRQMDATANPSIYPVPARNRVTVQTSPDLTGELYQVVDGTGRVVLQGTLDHGNTQVDVEDLNPGLYTVLIGEFRRAAVKFVKE